MSRINPLSREISAKIVYYGPGLSGKTTTLQYIHGRVRADQRGEMVSLATEGDRTIFFDFLPLAFERVRGMSVRLQLYTVPGQVYYAATRKLVLNGADGVVFVADSQEPARERNVESFGDLEENLAELGIELARFPLVIQYNKRDLPGAAPVDVLEKDLNRYGAPAFETCATDGTGVFDALKAILRLVVRDLKARRKAAERPPPSEPVLAEEEDAGLAAQVSAAAERAAAQPPPDRAVAPESLSHAALWGETDAELLAGLETQIRERAFAPAVRHAADVLSRLLGRLPGTTEVDGPMAKALILGLDGRDFLRLARLASKPDESVTEADALFALHVVVAARIRLADV